MGGYGIVRLFRRPADAAADAAPDGWYLAGLLVDPDVRRRGVGPSAAS